MHPGVNKVLANKTPLVAASPEAIIKTMARVFKTSSSIEQYREEMRQLVKWAKQVPDMWKYLTERVREILLPIADMGFQNRGGDLLAATLYTMGRGDPNTDSIITMIMEPEEELDIKKMKVILNVA